MQNPNSSWVDQKTVDETSFEDGVEPSMMFDDLNQTQMTFPPNNAGNKQNKKLKGLDAIAKKTHVSFPVPSDMKKQKQKPSVTGADFYKEVLDSDEKRKHKSQVRRGVRNGAVLLLSNYKPKDFGNAQIDLTVDGGQHLRSPGEDPPKISNKNIEQIFKDPVFDHKAQIRKL